MPVERNVRPSQGSTGPQVRPAVYHPYAPTRPDLRPAIIDPQHQRPQGGGPAPSIDYRPRPPHPSQPMPQPHLGLAPSYSDPHARWHIEQAQLARENAGVTPALPLRRANDTNLQTARPAWAVHPAPPIQTNTTVHTAQHFYQGDQHRLGQLVQSNPTYREVALAVEARLIQRAREDQATERFLWEQEMQARRAEQLLERDRRAQMELNFQTPQIVQRPQVAQLPQAPRMGQVPMSAGSMQGRAPDQVQLHHPAPGRPPRETAAMQQQLTGERPTQYWRQLPPPQVQVPTMRPPVQPINSARLVNQAQSIVQSYSANPMQPINQARSINQVHSINQARSIDQAPTIARPDRQQPAQKSPPRQPLGQAAILSDCKQAARPTVRPQPTVPHGDSAGRTPAQGAVITPATPLATGSNPSVVRESVTVITDTVIDANNNTRTESIEVRKLAETTPLGETRVMKPQGVALRVAAATPHSRLAMILGTPENTTGANRAAHKTPLTIPVRSTPWESRYPEERAGTVHSRPNPADLARRLIMDPDTDDDVDMEIQSEVDELADDEEMDEVQNSPQAQEQGQATAQGQGHNRARDRFGRQSQDQTVDQDMAQKPDEDTPSKGDDRLQLVLAQRLEEKIVPHQIDNGSSAVGTPRASAPTPKAFPKDSVKSNAPKSSNTAQHVATNETSISNDIDMDSDRAPAPTPRGTSVGPCTFEVSPSDRSPVLAPARPASVPPSVSSPAEPRRASILDYDPPIASTTPALGGGASASPSGTALSTATGSQQSSARAVVNNTDVQTSNLGTAGTRVDRIVRPGLPADKAERRQEVVRRLYHLVSTLRCEDYILQGTASPLRFRISVAALTFRQADEIFFLCDQLLPRCADGPETQSCVKILTPFVKFNLESIQANLRARRPMNPDVITNMAFVGRLSLNLLGERGQYLHQRAVGCADYLRSHRQ